MARPFQAELTHPVNSPSPATTTPAFRGSPRNKALARHFIGGL